MWVLPWVNFFLYQHLTIKILSLLPFAAVDYLILFVLFQVVPLLKVQTTHRIHILKLCCLLRKSTEKSPSWRNWITIMLWSWWRSVRPEKTTWSIEVVSEKSWFEALKNEPFHFFYTSVGDASVNLQRNLFNYCAAMLSYCCFFYVGSCQRG